MKKNKGSAWRLPVLLSLLWLAVTAVVLIVLYIITKYLPMLLGALTILMPTLIYGTVFAFCGSKPSEGNSADADATDAVEMTASPHATASDETEGSPVKKAGWLKRCAAWCVRVAKKFGGAFVRLYFRSRLGAAVTLIVLFAGGSQVLFWLMLRRATTIYKLNYLMPVIMVVIFVTYIIFEKWCAHVSADDEGGTAQLRNVRTAFGAGRLVLVLIAVAQVIKLLGFYELLRWVNIALAVVFCYATLFIVLSLAVKLLRREFLSEPDISIPVPFSGGKNRDLGVLSYLEKNTGITMRSLWSIKMIKKLVPYTVLISALMLWLCSGIVQVEAYQTGAVYRLGRLCDEPLQPGLHLTLPWPLDKVVLHDTETVNTVVIGYTSSENTDNTWTGTHGAQEYRLLLGGGNELVSINLRLEYKIDDVVKYLRSCSTPEKLLEAKAYELVTDRTIITDLDSLLSVDRSAFAESFKTELAQKLTEYDTGIELVGVVLESIHPPIDIADVYQNIIGAEIEAEKYILDAEATAAKTIANAEKQYDTSVNAAKADSYTKISAAESDVAEFMASVAADQAYPDAYRYYKYLKAIGNYYGGSRLVIVGEGVDKAQLYFGDFALLQ
ncbi:MAG: protease modulator HflK [Clostridia bacterium]|nr:protease modulator HflK [Clostridia bacterium]